MLQGYLFYFLVVDKYQDFFPNNLSKMPPQREVEFRMDLVLDTQPISIRAYWMASV